VALCFDQEQKSGGTRERNKTMSLIRALWRGDVPLWKTYWLFNVLIGAVLTGLVFYFESSLVGLYLTLETGAELINWALFGGIVGYGLFMLVAILRSANKYQGPKINAWLARIAVFLGAIQVWGVTSERLFPQITPSSLRQEAETINLALPSVLDATTRFDRVSTAGMSMTYHYTLLEYEIATDWDSEIYSEIHRSERLSALLPALCRDLEEYFSSGVTLIAEDRAVDGGIIAQAQIQPENCLHIRDLPVSPGQEMDTTEIATLATSAFAVITTNPGQSNEASGSGFAISSDGALITNLHVVEDAEQVRVQISTGEVYDDVDVLGADELRDLLILQVPATGLDVLPLVSDETVQLGEEIYVLGNPLGFNQTFSDGLVSSRRFNEAGWEEFQISAPISPGSSGGPVLNSRGEVIAVATSTSVSQDAQNLNFAVPIRYAYEILARSSEAVPFLDFISTVDFSNVSEDTLSRSEESSALFDDASPELIEALSGLQPWTQQVILRLNRNSSVFEPLGLEISDDSFEWKLLTSGESDMVTITLEAGNYFVSGVCDDDCIDLDLAVYDENLELLNSDSEIDPDPVVSFTVENSTQHSIEATMYECATDSCLYAIELYKEN
jgi:S1-C subfamily serine protease